METVGIITEYNPFHNGHLHHLWETKKLFPHAVVILILNGYFLQRGELSVLTKEEKTIIALEYGVDLVIELPFVFGGKSADYFAYYAIKLLDVLGCQKIVFGSEGNDVKILEQAAKQQLNNQNYDKLVKQYIAEGINYPTAIAKALDSNISSPNDLLGIAYIKAILKLKSKMKYYTIQRTNDYHDKESNAQIISATTVRERIKNVKKINKFIPKYPIKIDWYFNTDYFNLLKYKITTEQNLSSYLSVDEGLENRLKKYVNQAKTLDEFISLIKTKRYTYNRLNRMFIHILIGLTKKDYERLDLDYIRVLGFNDKGKKYLNTTKKDITIPLLTKKFASKVLTYEKTASAVYDLITKKNTLAFEKKNIPILKRITNFYNF